MRPAFVPSILAAAAILGVAGCERPPGEIIEQRREAFGTTFVIRVWALPSDALYATIGKAFARVETIDGLLDDKGHDSDVARLNRAAGEPAVPVTPETLRVLDLAQQIAAQSDGAFDVTWAPLRGAWNFDAPDTIRPDQDAFAAKVDRLRQYVGWGRLEVDTETSTARLADRGMQVGLAGLAKGLALDEAARVLRENGLDNFVIDAGGDVIVHGRRGDRDWTVGVRHPRDERGNVFVVLPVRDRAVATTGDYETFRIVDGKRYAHVIDPRSGEPARACISATVIHPLAVVADALATAAFVLGPEQGLALVARYRGADAILVDPNLGVHVTRGLEEAVLVRWLKEDTGP